MYFACDSIPFPSGGIAIGAYPALSRHTVLFAEQIILRVVKMTVPVCYFAQFARPLWHKIMSVDDEKWRQQLLLNIKEASPLSLQAKQVICARLHLVLTNQALEK